MGRSSIPQWKSLWCNSLLKEGWLSPNVVYRSISWWPSPGIRTLTFQAKLSVTIIKSSYSSCLSEASGLRGETPQKPGHTSCKSQNPMDEMMKPWRSPWKPRKSPWNPWKSTMEIRIKLIPTRAPGRVPFWPRDATPCCRHCSSSRCEMGTR